MEIKKITDPIDLENFKVIITLEGIDGCGKSTLQRMLCDHLKGQMDVFCAREPGTTQFGEGLREFVQTFLMCDNAKLLAYASSIVNSWELFILPFLKNTHKNGCVVICDRWIPSIRAYQDACFREFHTYFGQLASNLVKSLELYIQHSGGIETFDVLLNLDWDKCFKNIKKRGETLNERQEMLLAEVSSVYFNYYLENDRKIINTDNLSDAMNIILKESRIEEYLKIRKALPKQSKLGEKTSKRIKYQILKDESKDGIQ